MHDLIQVETREGRWPPVAFTWNGRRYRVLEIGRQEEVEGELKVMVMVEGKQVFELSFHQESESWHVRRRPEDFGPVRGRI